jgi:transposase-like protein
MGAGTRQRNEEMPTIKKNYAPSLKAKVAMEAIKGTKTASQIAQSYGVHPTQVGFGKEQALAGLTDVFSNGRALIQQQAEAEKDELYKQSGQLKVELNRST